MGVRDWPEDAACDVPRQGRLTRSSPILDSCAGEYTLFAPVSDIEERFDASFDYSFDPRYNAAPSQSLPVITNEESDAIQPVEWGLVPSWADDRLEFGLINARAETLSETASFSEAYERRRCVVPADGFYEWTETSGGKEPYRITLDDESVFVMAGLWERWDSPQRQTGLGEFGGVDVGEETETVETFTIVTTEPNDVVGELHHRMAVVLDPDEVATWLHGDESERGPLLRPYDGEMQAYQVSRAVNDPSNDSPDVVEPVA